MRQWYAVRGVFRWVHADGESFEERITLWQAESMEAAIERAEEEARAYAEHTGVTYLDFAQAYATGESEIRPGTEVFSLLRDSPLPPAEYPDRFFATGREHETSAGVDMETP